MRQTGSTPLVHTHRLRRRRLRLPLLLLLLWMPLLDFELGHDFQSLRRLDMV